MFAGAGGEIRQSDVTAIAPAGDGWRVSLSAGEISARHVVVALGPWSADLLRPLGYRVPLVPNAATIANSGPTPGGRSAPDL